MSTDTVYSNLIAVASKHPDFTPRQTGESVQAYLGRVVAALSDEQHITEQDWAKLSEAAQAWHNGCIDENLQLKAELTVPEGFPADPPPAPARRRVVTKPVEPAPEPIVEAAPEPKPEPKPALKPNGDGRYVDEHGQPLTGIRLYNAKLAAGEVTRRPRGASKKTLEIAEKMELQKPVRTARTDTVTAKIRKAILMQPSITVDELRDLLAQEGHTPSVATITTSRASFLSAIRTLEELGCFVPYAANTGSVAAG